MNRHIVVNDIDNVPSIYRCEIREDNLRSEFDVRELGETLYIRERRDILERARHRLSYIESFKDNSLEYVRYFPEELADRFDSPESFGRYKTATVKIYRPGNACKDDLIVLAYTRIENGGYIQLFGGIYSECETNADKTIKDNYNYYSEYIEFKIPTELVPNEPFNAVHIRLIPVEGICEGTFEPSTKYIPGIASYAFGLHIDLEAMPGFDDLGRFGIAIKSRVPVEKINEYYKYPGGTDKFVRETFMNMLHYRIELATNYNFDKNALFYETEYEYDIEDLEKKYIDYFYEFDEDTLLCNIGEKVLDDEIREEYLEKLTWNNLPGRLLGRVVMVIDINKQWSEEEDYIPLTFTSNTFALPKESFKYIFGKRERANNLKIPNTDEFMKNINIVNKIEKKTPEKILIDKPVKLLFKPVFFKASELQEISLVAGIVQRIGINLQAYETKVSDFTLYIDGKRFRETERSDMYVIFKIDASLLSDTSSKYHILDQDGEYVASGEVTIK